MNFKFLLGFSALVVDEKEIVMYFEDAQKMAFYDEDSFSWKSVNSLIFEEMETVQSILQEKVINKMGFDRDLLEKELILALQKDAQPLLAEYLDYLETWKNNILGVHMEGFTEEQYANSALVAVNEIFKFENSQLVATLNIPTDEFVAIKNQLKGLYDSVQKCPVIYADFQKINKKIQDIPGEDADFKIKKENFAHNHKLILDAKVSQAHVFPESINLSKENLNFMLSNKVDTLFGLFEKLK